MPRKLKLNSLTSDKHAVQQLISEAIEYGDIVGELQYREKLEKLDKEISLIKNANETNASVALFFGGEPVLGSQGILASFAGNVLENFQELVNKSFASKENGSLGERGKIPLKANSNLMITQVAKGSFGFILDEVSDQIEITETALKHTVDYVLELINASAQPDDETFEKLIESLDKRVLQSLKDFFITLDKAHSTMRLVGDEQEYSLDSNWIHRARLRTEATEIEEDEDLVYLKVLGLLPEHCKFEAVTREGNIIYGSTTRLAAEQFRSELIGKQVKVNLLTKSIKPLHRPERTVYKLIEFVDKNL
ncbi:hypothetical protein RHA02_003535 [Vibrio cholerae]|uniref:hypothetical protein n=1 Tax=Vibrio cholerae TaxID=666 RepID=UPI000E0A4D89|nr:hypothetical protein [Vibrio cholerae]EHS1102552.1 hypothetical protein [Vibrio cholerae]EJL6673662.1 hypothetical protein [Vibrio cholerae]EKF9738634.1 hypothetical protein [Vibrio cholerae]ELB8603753.1 hypothetical protein [Vibrio cholerae]